MSEIDIERLKVDAAYWDEKDPSDGEATHYDLTDRGQIYAWVRLDGATWYSPATDRNGGFRCWEKTAPVSINHRIPRPTKPEWVDGLPPEGERCEVQMGSYWYAGEVKGRNEEAIWFKADDRGDYWTIMSASSVRPIKSDADRLREEVFKEVEEVSGRWNKNIDCSAAITATVEALLNSDKFKITRR